MSITDKLKAIDEADKASFEQNPVPRMGPRPTVNLRSIEDALMADVPIETLAELLQQLTELQARHRKETDDHLAKIVAKINFINSAIK